MSAVLHGASHDDGVYVLGMSCKLGNANNLEEYWKNLIMGVDMVGQSEPRWPNNVYGLPEGLSVIERLDRFDSEYFDFSNEKANDMDPQIRLLLEVATEAVLDSAVIPFDLSNSKCGVYTSVYKSEVQSLNYPIEHCSTAMHAAKLATFFNLNGPSMCIDSACSSSLIATNLAFNDLKSNKIQYALVTATSLMFSPNQSLQNFRLGMTSKTGKCHTWDETADGYVRAEGIFAILLGRGSAHPRLYAEIVAGASNSDGYKPEGIVHPSSGALLSLFREVYSKVSLSELAYMECHATGTQAGDVAETSAISDILKEKNMPGPLLIGSCKSNLGHAEWAAGLASLIKAVLCLSRKTIPPNINLDTPNPKITGITEGKLVPVTKLLILPDGLVGVTAMGFGGSNCHLVLKAVNASDFQAPQNLLVLTASRTAEGLDEQDKVMSKMYDPQCLSFVSQVFASTLCGSMLHRRAAIHSGRDNVYNRVEFLANSHIHNLRQAEEVFIIVHDVGVVWSGDECSMPCIDAEDDNPMECAIFKHWFEEIKESYLAYGMPGRSMGDGDDCLNDVLSRSAAYILAVVCMFDEVGVIINGSVGAGLSDLIAGAIANCLHPYNVISLLKLISRELDTETSHQDMYALEVDSDFETLATLFLLDIRIVCMNTFYSTTISFKAGQQERILTELDNRNISYRPIALVHPGLYTEYLWKFSKFFVGGLNSKLIMGETDRTIRNKSWYNPSYTANYDHLYRGKQITPADIGTLLGFTIHLNGAIVKIPLTCTQVHIGMCRKPNWVPDDAVYINASSYRSILHAFATLYLKGFNLNPIKLNNLTQVSGNCPNIGQFVQWDHSCQYSVPHWLQFSASEGQEKPKNCFRIQCEGNLESLLWVIWKRIAVSFCKIESAIELYNLDLFPDRINVTNHINVVLEVLEASKTFKAIELTESKTLVKGSYKLENYTYTNTSVINTLEIDDLRSNKPIMFEVTWRGDVLACVSSVFEKLQQMIDVHDRRLCIQSFGLRFSNFPTNDKIDTQISFSAELTTGLCQGNGFYFKMSPVCIQESYYQRTSSNLNIPLLALDLSDIASPTTPRTSIEIHVIRLYQLQDALEHNRSLVLVYCRSHPTHAHNIGISLITKNKTTTLLNLPITAKISCQHAVGVVIPHLLAFSVVEKLKSSAINDLCIFAAQSDYLVTSLLFLCQPIAQNAFVVIEGHTSDDSTASSSSKITDSSGKISEMSCHSKDSDEFKYLSDSSYPADESDTHTDITSPISSVSTVSLSIREELFPEVSVLPYNETSTTLIQTQATNNEIKHVVSFHPDLAKTCKLLSSGGTLIHMGEVDSENLGIGICAQFGTILSLNPIFSLTRTVGDLNDSFLTADETNDWRNTLWTMYNHTKEVAPLNGENNSVYRSGATISTIIPVDLHEIHNKLTNHLKENSLTNLDDLDWMGNLLSLVHSSKTKRITRLFQSPKYAPDASTPVNLRFKSSNPFVHLHQHVATEKRGGVQFGLSDEAPVLSPVVTVSLSRPDESALVKMNDVLQGVPVFLIHPVTGVLNLLRHFANELSVPCYGLQQTSNVPADSLQVLAQFYLGLCAKVIKNNPLRLIGYSYGACIAYVMGIEAQKIGVDVSHLIMLDGSPDYVRFPLVKINEKCGFFESASVMDTEKLIAFLQIYGNVEVNSIRAELMDCGDRTKRVDVAVNYLTSCDSRKSDPKFQNKWQKASRQIIDQREPKLLTAASKILLKQRTQRAYAFLANMDLIDWWSGPTEEFKGDIYLFRIEDSPVHCPDLAEDYGLAKLASGEVHIKSYNATHESLVGLKNVPRLVRDVMLLFIV